MAVVNVAGWAIACATGPSGDAVGVTVGGTGAAGGVAGICWLGELGDRGDTVGVAVGRPAAGITNGCLHLGHAARRPANCSGTWNVAPHWQDT